MSRILITGGNGVLGREIVKRLTATPHTVCVMSRKPAPPDARTEWAQADLETGAGIAEALKGVDVIINSVTNAFKSAKVDILGTQRLLEQARAAEVKHVIHISIVGIDRIPTYSYYHAKIEAEKVVMASGVPFSIFRATQFHTLLDYFLSPLRRFPWSPVLMLPPTSQFQLIDPGEVADYLLPYISDQPVGRIPDVGGPEVLTLDHIARTWLAAQGLRRPLVYLPLMACATREGFRNGYNTIPTNTYGRITWAGYLQRRYSPVNHISAKAVAK